MSNRVLRRITEEAMGIWPESPGLYAMLGWVPLQENILGMAKSPQENIEKGFEMT
jgi:hypothetical protein